MSFPVSSAAPDMEFPPAYFQYSLGVHIWPVMPQKLENGETVVGTKFEFCLIKGAMDNNEEAINRDIILDETSLNARRRADSNPWADAIVEFVGQNDFTDKGRSLVAVTIVAPSLPCSGRSIKRIVKRELNERRIRDLPIRVLIETDLIEEAYFNSEERKLAAIIRIDHYFYIYSKHKSIENKIEAEGEVHQTLQPVADKLEAICAKIKKDSSVQNLIVLIVGTVNEDNIQKLKELPSVQVLAEKANFWLHWKMQRSNRMKNSLAYTAAAFGVPKMECFPNKFDFDFEFHF